MPKKLKKKKKIKFLSVLIFLLVCVIGYFLVTFALELKINNIFIYGNNIVSDQEIIDLAKLNDYPSFFKTFSKNIRKRVLTNECIRSVKVKKSFFNVVKIYIEEYSPLFYKDSEGKTVLANGVEKQTTYTYSDIPVLINYVVDTVYNDFVEEMSKLDNSIKTEISEIEYKPNEYDKSRFLLYMNDGNYIYINIDRFQYLSYYNEIYPTLGGKKGILYLDSGNHFQPF